MTFSAFLWANWPFVGLLALAVLALVIVEWYFGNNRYCLSPFQAVKMMNHSKTMVVDLREQKQYQAGHINKAKAMTIAQIKKNPDLLKKNKKHPIVLVCQHGGQSKQLAQWLHSKEFDKPYALAGGMQAWRNDKMPIVKANNQETKNGKN